MSSINELLRVRFPVHTLRSATSCNMQRVSRINGADLSHPRYGMEDVIILLRPVNKEL